MGRLDDKVAVITGAASGIGLAATKLFAQEGADVLAIDIDEGRLNEALGAVGDRVSAFAADLTQPDQVRRAMEVAVERYGGIDILLPNAGIWGTVATMDAYPLETFKRVIEVNLTSVFITTQAAIPHMVKRGGGSVVFSSSAGGTGGKPGNVAYAATKHAVLGIMRTTAVEWGSAGIRANAVLPGVIETPMIHELERTFSPDDPDKGAEALRSDSLLKRYGAAEEVAELMLYLASDASSFCTGGAYLIDGGMQLA
jgi:3alpha(or 20beta)-hydroxysteroid dehydrogenase